MKIRPCCRHPSRQPALPVRPSQTLCFVALAESAILDVGAGDVCGASCTTGGSEDVISKLAVRPAKVCEQLVISTTSRPERRISSCPFTGQIRLSWWTECRYTLIARTRRGRESPRQQSTSTWYGQEARPSQAKPSQARRSSRPGLASAGLPLSLSANTGRPLCGAISCCSPANATQIRCYMCPSQGCISNRPSNKRVSTA